MSHYCVGFKAVSKFNHFDQMNWWVINETLLAMNGRKEYVSPLRSLRLLDWKNTSPS